MRLTALWWWIDRWRKSTAYTDMTLEEQGAYRNLLDEATLRGGPLPNDERILGKACGDAHAWKRVRKAVLARFILTADGWRNATLDGVNKKSHAIRAERAVAGAKGNESRWGQYRNGIANPSQPPSQTESQTASPPSPSLNSNQLISDNKPLRNNKLTSKEKHMNEPSNGNGHDRKATRKLLEKFAHQCLDKDPTQGFSDVKEQLKLLCAKEHLLADLERINNAVDAVMTMRERKRK